MKKVSVIIPAYNKAEFTVKAVESVLGQVYENIEVIVVDDGSTDDTRSRLAFFGDKIRYVYQENSGACSARNAGIRLAAGEYLAFLDCDDIYYPQKISAGVEYLDIHPECGFLHTAACPIGEDGMPLPKHHRKEYAEYAGCGDISRRLLFNNVVCNSTVLARKSCFDKAGLFDESIFFPADWDMWMRLAENFSCGFIGDCLTGYRISANYIMNNLEKGLKEEIAVLDKAFKRNNVSPRVRRVCLSNSYRRFARLFAIKGELAAAKNAFSRAIFLNPFNLRALAVFTCLIMFPKFTRKRFESKYFFNKQGVLVCLGILQASGGAEQYVVDTCRYLKEVCRVSVLLPVPLENNQYIEALGKENIEYLQAYFSPFKNFSLFCNTIFLILQRTWRGDIIITHLQSTNIATGLLRLFFSFRWVAVVHSMYYNRYVGFYTRFKYFLERRFLFLSDKNIFVSGISRESYRMPRKAKNIVIHKGPGLELKPQAKPEEMFLIAGIGDITPNKRTDVFCAAATLAKNKCPGFEFTWIGGKPADIEKYKSCGNNVNFTGNIQRGKALELLMRARVIINTSFYEAWPYCILEALAAGCFPVVTHSTGAAEIVEASGVGYICAKEKKEEIAEEISAFLINNKERISRQKVNASGFLNRLESDFRYRFIETILAQ